MPAPIFIILWLVCTLLSYMLIRQACWMRKWSWTYQKGLLVVFLAFCLGPVGTTFAYLFNVINEWIKPTR